jgi:predicted Zn-dependent protease with MMP-like domain
VKQETADRFDALLERVLESVPPAILELMEETAVIVLDEPTPDMLAELGMAPDEADDLCGLHTGVMATERSIEDSAVLPSQIHLFRAGIIAIAGGFGDSGSDARVSEQIRITLLHEIGHEYGLDEDQLADLGYD